MSASEAINCMYRTVFDQEPLAVTCLTGGCVHEVYRCDGAQVSCVMKVAAAEDRELLEGESAGLEAIAATKTVQVPEVLGLELVQDHAVLAVEWLEPGDEGDVDWAAFGEQLAALHGAEAPEGYGFKGDNHIGRTPQSNAWCDDWVVFMAEHRLQPQVNMAMHAGHLEAADMRLLDGLIERLDIFLPRTPPASLLHGDLWSGNAMVLADASVAVIDPSCSHGDPWADIAMMRLFGGFPGACESAWRAHHDVEDSSIRVTVYQLYHQLNHLNLFGRGYLSGIRAALERLG